MQTIIVILGLAFVLIFNPSAYAQRNNTNFDQKIDELSNRFEEDLRTQIENEVKNNLNEIQTDMERLRNESKETGDKFRNEIKQKVQINSSGDNRISAKVEIRQNNEPTQKIEIANNRFEIQGKITALSNNSVQILNQTITITPEKFGDLDQKGVLRLGNNIKIKGEIRDNIKIAREIKAEGSGNNSSNTNQNTQNQVEIRVRSVFDQAIIFIQTIFTRIQNL